MSHSAMRLSCRLKYCSIAIMAASIGLMTSAANGQVFSEGDFAPGSWSAQFVFGGGGGSCSPLVTGGGNPGDMLTLTHSMPGGSPGGGFCAYWSWTLVTITNAVVDPGTVGGIAGIEFSLDSLPIESTNAATVQSQTALVVQNGRAYYAAVMYTSSGGWRTQQTGLLKSVDFIEIVNQPPCQFGDEQSHPDFSAAGSPIALGYARGNSTGFGGNGAPTSITVGADNWMMVVRPCRADFNLDGSVDFFDYLDFVDAFSSNLPAADFNGDSAIDFFDYLDFVDAFSAGC